MAKYHKIKAVSDACCRLQQNRVTGSMQIKGKSACGIVLLDQANNIIAERSRYLVEMTVPQAEYSALIFALDSAVEYCRGGIEVWMDSELVIKQMTGEYCIRSEHVKALFDQVKQLELRYLLPVKYFHHNRGSVLARKADSLANAEYSRNHAG